MIPFWRYVRERLDAIADQTLAIRDLVHSLGTTLAMRPPPVAPPPFVCVLVEAQSPVGPIAMGNASSVKGSTTIELRPDLLLCDGRVIVFCDLERVDVRGIFLGVDLLTASPGRTCPVARFKEWPPGVLLYVQVTAR